MEISDKPKLRDFMKINTLYFSNISRRKEGPRNCSILKGTTWQLSMMHGPQAEVFCCYKDIYRTSDKFNKVMTLNNGSISIFTYFDNFIMVIIQENLFDFRKCTWKYFG